MKVRVKDIARKAGVSPASVSNALNGRGGVSEATRQRIHTAAREMGYAITPPPGQIKDTVRLVSLKRHGLVVMDTQFFAEIIQALERQCHQAGYQLAISNIHMEQDADYLERVRAICRDDCAGILLLATELYDEDIALFSKTRAPLVVVDSLFRNQPFNCVVMNNLESGYLAAERLIRLGHRRIEHITSSVRFNNMDYRRQGFQSAMDDAGLPYDAASFWLVSPTLEGARWDMAALLEAREKPMPTAFFAANDIIAAGCVRALKDKGYKVPRDLSIIGMDDLDICRITSPALSSIRVPREEIARAALARLREMMAAKERAGVLKIQVGVELVDRQSVLDLNPQ